MSDLVHSSGALRGEPEAVGQEPCATLPCISILQPYAWLIVNGYKDIENREWFTRFRGRILIHAGKRYSRRDHDEYTEELSEDFPHRPAITLPPFEQMQLGGIVGSATVTDCVREHPSPWKILGSWGFVLKDQRVREFVPYRGQLGIFRVPADVISPVRGGFMIQTASGSPQHARSNSQDQEQEALKP